MPKALSFSGTDEEFEQAKLKEYQLIWWGRLGSRLTQMFETKMSELLSAYVKPQMLTADELEFNPKYDLQIRHHSKNRDPDGLTMKTRNE